MKRINKYITAGIMTLVMISLLVSCSSASQDSSEDHHEENESTVELTEPQFVQAGIQIGSFEQRTMGSEILVNGVIDVPPQSNISITIPYGGFIKYTEMLPGSRVRKGQLLVIVENPDFIQFQQDYLESLANQEFLKAEFERQEKLYQENVASGKNFQQAKSSYLANEARIKSLEERLKLIGFNPTKIKTGEVSASVNIYSPVNGSVRDVYTNTGKYVSPQDAIMDITNAEDLHVELTVYENDIPRVQEGQRIRYSLSNAPDDWNEAEVFLIGSGVREDRSITVHGHLKKENTSLKPGMYVSAKIETGSSKVWTAPEEAVVRFAGSHFVFTYKGQQQESNKSLHEFEMTEVIPGILEDGFLQVTLKDPNTEISELKVVTKGAFTLLAKAKNTEEEGGHGH